MIIPTDASEFTPEFVSALVQTRYETITVGRVEVVDAHVFGAGDASTAGRIDIRVGDVTGGELPERLVVKVARPDLPATPLYANEVSVYSCLRDELALETPRCFGASFDPESGQFGLVLDDLDLRGATFGNVLVDVGVDSVRSILTQVADLHAAYWSSSRFDDDLGWVQPHTAGAIHTLFNHPRLVPAVIASEVENEPFKAEIVASVGQSAQLLLEQVQRAQREQARHATTIVHGDLHVGNTYYLPDGTGGFIDWQLTARGRYIHDVAYYLITSMPADIRRANEHELLAGYLDRLRSHGIDAPTPDETWAEYRAAAAWCLYIGWLTTPVENYGWSINVVNHIRLATAYRDLETASAIAALD